MGVELFSSHLTWTGIWGRRAPRRQRQGGLGCGALSAL